MAGEQPGAGPGPVTPPVSPVPARAAIVGCGEIGGGWAALFAAHGTTVRLFDPDAGASDRARRALELAAVIGVGRAAATSPGAIEAMPDLRAALDGAVWVQESLPERLSLKRDVLGSIAASTDEDVIVASSTSSFTVRELSDDVALRRRLVIAHPLQPVYAVPVVELCAAPGAPERTMMRAAAVMAALGRDPIVVRGELPGLIANRLAAAMLREALDLVARGAIEAPALDRLVARGIALGWTAAGPLVTEAIGAGGELDTFLDRMDEPLRRLWSSLATWVVLGPERRASLAGAMQTAHAPSPETWAVTLARITRAVEETRSLSPPGRS